MSSTAVATSPAHIPAGLTATPMAFNGGHTNLVTAGLTFDCVAKRPQRRDTAEMVLHAWRMATRTSKPVALVPTVYGWATQQDYTRADLSNGGIVVSVAGDVHTIR